MDRFDNIETGIQIINNKMEYNYLNNTLLKQVGKTLEDHIGKKMQDVYPGIQQTEMFQTIKRVIQNKKHPYSESVKNEFIFENGEISYWELKIEKIPEGVIIFSNNIIKLEEGRKLLSESNSRLKKEVKKAIFKLKSLNNKLKEEKDNFFKLFNDSPDPLFVYDIETDKITDCNISMEKAFQATKDQIIGLNPFDISPEYQEFAQKSTYEYGLEVGQKINEQRTYRYRWNHKRFNGEVFPCEVSLIPTIINQRNCYIASLRDNTELYNLESENKRQAKIALRNSKLASIGELAAGVGHEINNPLAIVQGYIKSLQTLQNRNIQISEKILTETLDKMQIATSRIINIVRGLRGLARDDHKENEFFSPFDSVSETYHLLKKIYATEEINLTLNCELEQEQILLRGNQGRFQQILMNLLSNAKDAIENISQKSINIHYIEKASSIKLSIQDNGTGVKSSYKDKIFDPFFTTKEVNKGTGIGLSLTNQFVTEMGGTIDFASNEGDGTTFFLSFPNTIEYSDFELRYKS